MSDQGNEGRGRRDRGGKPGHLVEGSTRGHRGATRIRCRHHIGEAPNGTTRSWRSRWPSASIMETRYVLFSRVVSPVVPSLQSRSQVVQSSRLPMTTQVLLEGQQPPEGYEFLHRDRFLIRHARALAKESNRKIYMLLVRTHREPHLLPFP